MSETERLYYGQRSLLEHRARVLSVSGSGGFTDLVLDSTIFYPEGGGQPWDLGTIEGLPLVSVTEESGRILHRLAGALELKTGDQVSLVLDAKRRRDHSQQHSGQHLLSAILERRFGVHTLSFHLGSAASTIDVSCPDPDSGVFAEAEATADAFIATDRPFRVHLCPPEDSSRFDLRKQPPQGEAELRIVEIDAYDWVPCCGTHVSSCSELRTLKILSTERYKGNTRLYFVAGDRAVTELGTRFTLLKTAAGLLGCSAQEVPARAEALADGIKLKKSELEGLVRDRARLEVELALASPAAVSAEMRCLRFSYDDREAEASFETAKAAAARGFPSVVVSTKDRTVGVLVTQAMAASQSLPALGAALKPLLAASGARGGGGPYSFRASFPSAQDAEAFADGAAALFERK